MLVVCVRALAMAPSRVSPPSMSNMVVAASRHHNGGVAQSYCLIVRTNHPDRTDRRFRYDGSGRRKLGSGGARVAMVGMHFLMCVNVARSY